MSLDIYHQISDIEEDENNKFEQSNIFDFEKTFECHKSSSLSLDEDNNYDDIYFNNNDKVSNLITEEKPEKKIENENNYTTVKTPENQNFIPNLINGQQIIKNKKKKNYKKEGNDLFLGKKLGRKKVKKNENDEKDEEQEKENDIGHDKFSEDNIMRKIKTNIIDYTINKLNDSLIDKNYQFLKIDKKISEDLKRDMNVNLLERTILDIFNKEQIRSKYKRINYDNKILIKNILEKNEEKKTIEILNKTYFDMIIEIREQNLDYFLNKIIKKEKNMKKKSNIEQYIHLLKDLLFRYKDWFKNKKGRNREKNIKNN